MISKSIKILSILFFVSFVLVACSSVVDQVEDLSEELNEEENLESLLLKNSEDVEVLNPEDALLAEQKEEETIVLPEKNEFLENAPQIATPNLLAIEKENRDLLISNANKELPSSNITIDDALLEKEKDDIIEAGEEDNPYFSEINEATQSPLEHVSSRVFSLMAKRINTFNNFDIEEAIEKPFEEKAKPIIVDNVSIQLDNLIYANNLLSNFVPVARSKFISKSDVNIKNIQDFAGYIDTQLALVKHFYNPDDKNYVYDVVFLQGDVKNETNLWNINLESAETLEETLKQNNIINLDDYKNVGYNENTINADTQIDLGIEEDDDNNLANNENLEPELDEDRNEILDENGNPQLKPILNIKNISKADKAEQEAIDDKLTLKKEIELQKKLLNFRTEILVGLWEDVITGELVEIRRIDGDKNRRNKIYGAFVVDAKYFAGKQPKINDMFVWNNGDLRFLFSSISYTDYYLDEEKMVVKTSITPHDAKNLIIITLPNRKYKYFRPVLKDGLLAEVDKEVYGELKRTAKGINTSHSYKTQHRYDEKIATSSNSWLDKTKNVFATFPAFFGVMGILGTTILLSLFFI